MKQGPRITPIALAIVVGAFMTFQILSVRGCLDYDVWKREHPLVSPIATTSVRSGAITLADGRVLRPAGISRPDAVSAEDYDKAVRVIVAQGVVVTRDFGDGRAFLLAEPKFYNWCGTRNADGIPWKRWAGSYLQCPVSELLIQAGYAIPALDQPGLTARERWRLEGVEHISGIAESPTPVSDELTALRCSAAERCLSNYDHTLESLWKPPPSP